MLPVDTEHLAEIAARIRDEYNSGGDNLVQRVDDARHLERLAERIREGRSEVVAQVFDGLEGLEPSAPDYGADLTGLELVLTHALDPDSGVEVSSRGAHHALQRLVERRRHDYDGPDRPADPLPVSALRWLFRWSGQGSPAPDTARAEAYEDVRAALSDVPLQPSVVATCIRMDCEHEGYELTDRDLVVGNECGYCGAPMMVRIEGRANAWVGDPDAPDDDELRAVLDAIEAMEEARGLAVYEDGGYLRHEADKADRYNFSWVARMLRHAAAVRDELSHYRKVLMAVFRGRDREELGVDE